MQIEPSRWRHYYLFYALWIVVTDIALYNNHYKFKQILIIFRYYAGEIHQFKYGLLTLQLKVGWALLTATSALSNLVGDAHPTFLAII